MLDCLQSVLLMCTAYIVQHILMRQYLFSHLLQHSCLQYWHAVIYLRSAVSFVLHILHFSIMSSLALTSPHLLTGKLSAKFYYWECDWHINGLLWKAHQMKRFLSKIIGSRLEVWYEDDSLTVISSWESRSGKLFIYLPPSVGSPDKTLHDNPDWESRRSVPRLDVLFIWWWLIDDDYPNSGS